MDRKKILIYCKLALFFLFSLSIICSAAATDCCVNPYNQIYLCADLERGLLNTQELCCGSTAGGLPLGISKDYCLNNWFVPGEDCFLQQGCDIGCCVGETKTCEYIQKGECDLDATATFNLNKDCNEVSGCITGCCCDGVNLVPRLSCDPAATFYPNVNTITQCRDLCQGVLDPCDSLSCEYEDINCVCGTAKTSPSNPYCCSTDSTIFSTQSSCLQSSGCIVTGTFSVSGTVKDASGNIIMNAVVGIETKQALSSFSGYIIEDMQPGTYTITASATGYTQGSKQITIVNNNLPNTNFVLSSIGLCGNGVLEEGEFCDKAELNGVRGSGCTVLCTQEGICGNGVLEYPEQCDDRNTVPGDGCSASCMIESVCGNAQRTSPSYIDMTNNPWVEGNEQCDDGNTDRGDGCSPLCMREVPCSIGSTRAESCVSQYLERNVTGADGLTYTYRCPTKETCVSSNTSGVGRWGGTCTIINENCPTTCQSLGGRYCLSTNPVCQGEIFSPDVVEGSNLGLYCCEEQGQCVEQVNECTYTDCNQSNSGAASGLPCRCGSTEATASKPYCCKAENGIFSLNTGSLGCYVSTTRCKPTCEVPDGQTFMSIADFYSANGYGCICEGQPRSSGFCCSDGVYKLASGADCIFEKNFAIVEGYISDTEPYPDGTGISGAEVMIKGKEIRDEQEIDFTLRAITDANGYYVFRSVPINANTPHTLIANKRREYLPNSLDVMITGHRLLENAEGLHLALQQLPKFDVSGIVQREKDNIIQGIVAGADVSILGTALTVTTDNDGKYKFEARIDKGVPQGTHMFLAHYTGLVDAKRREIITDDTENIDFILRDGNCYLGKYLADFDIRTKGYEFLSEWTIFEPIDVANVTPEKGILTAKIEWLSKCDATEFNIYRCEGDYDECVLRESTQPQLWKYLDNVSSDKTEYQDKNLKPNTEYCYKVGAEYRFPFIAEVISELYSKEKQCFTTGDIECVHKKDLVSFCQGKDVYECDGNNTIKLKNSCGDERCIQESAVEARCFADASCSTCSGPLGLFHKIFPIPWIGGASKECSQIPFCYEDYTNTSVDIYYDCSGISSCYDYNSEQACQNDSTINSRGNKVNAFNNRCLPKNCTWEADTRYGHLGFGVCREQLLSERCGDSDCDGIKDNDDTDDDNDYSPDSYDYEPNTANSMYQECRRCMIDEDRNTIFTKCDSERCSLYGKCYFDGSICLSEREASCDDYQTSDDCITDIFGFSICNWTDEGCINDADGDGIKDCEGIDCLHDFNPPYTKIPLLPAYNKANLLLKASVFDDFTESYGNSKTYCNHTDADGNQLNWEDILFLRDSVNITEDGDYSVGYYSVNYYPSEYSMEFNRESMNALEFELDNTAPKLIPQNYSDFVLSHDKMYYSYNYIDDDQDKEIRFSYLIDSRLVGEEQYLSDLIINFTLDEPALCRIKLNSSEGVSQALLNFNGINWEYDEYGENYTLEWDDLPDGSYDLDYVCFDKVFNKVASKEDIYIKSDPSIIVIQPSLVKSNKWGTNGVYRFNTDIIPFEVETKNPFSCQILGEEETYGTGIPLDAVQVGTKYIHKKDLVISPSVSEGYYHMKVGCMTSFGPKYEQVHFFIDKIAPATTFIKSPSSPPYDIDTWYKKAHFNITCRDPKILSPISKQGEFGCANVTWCIGPNCEPYLHQEDNDYTSDIVKRQGKDDTLSEKRALDICYQSIDTGGNEERQQCRLLKIDSIAPIIDYVYFTPKATLNDNIFLSSIIGNYLTTNDDYKMAQPLDNAKEWISDFSLDYFDMKFRLKLGKIDVNNENEFEVARFRNSAAGYYSVRVNAYEDKVSISKPGSWTEIQNYDFSEGKDYEFAITGTTTNFFTLSINGDEIVTRRDVSGPYRVGDFVIPKVQSPSPNIIMINRSVDRIRIGGAAERASPLSKTWVIVNEGTAQQQRYDITSGFGVIDYLKIDIPNEGANSVKVCSTDSAVEGGNTGCETYYAYQDHIGPVIEMHVVNEIGANVESPTINTNQQLFAQYGNTINFSIYVEDEEWTENVRYLDFKMYDLNGGVILENYIDRPGENLLIQYQQDPGCINRMDCTLPEGKYRVALKAGDELGNTREKEYYFEVKDSIGPRFRISMSNPDGFFNYTLRGYTYEINITSSEPISRQTMPELWFEIGGQKTYVRNIEVMDDFTYKGTLEIGYGAHLNNIEQAVSFQIRGYDRQETLGRVIEEGSDFNIDTRGYGKPIVYYPDLVYYSSNGRALITGFDGDLESGRMIRVQAARNLTNYRSITEWIKNTSSTTKDEPVRYTIPGQIESTVLAGEDTITVARDDNLGEPGQEYIDFATHNKEKRDYYEIQSYTPLTEDIATIKLTEPLEQDVNGTFTAYSARYPKGWFGVEANLEIGENYLYTFSYDEHNVRSEAATKVVRAFYDPFAPVITPVSPYSAEVAEPEHLISPDKDQDVVVNVEENITDIIIDSAELQLRHRQRGETENEIIRCNCTACFPEDAGIMNCISDIENKNMTLVFEAAGGQLPDAVYNPTFTAKDRAGNTGIYSWIFEIDGNTPHNPVVDSDAGEQYKNVLYTADKGDDFYVDFLLDQGKFVRLDSYKITDKDGNDLGLANGFTLLNEPTDYYDIADDYSARYSLTLNGELSGDGKYYVEVSASKLFASDRQTGDLNYSQAVTRKGEFNIDTTAPEINFIMQNPTMLKSPNVTIMTDDPSRCVLSTDEQQASESTTFNELNTRFGTRLASHSFSYTNINPGGVAVYIQNKDYYTGTHIITARCTNLLGLVRTSEYNFSIIPPNRDKVYYQEGDTIEIRYKIGITGLTANNFNIDFSQSGLTGDKVPVRVSGPIENPAGVYTLTYRLGGTNYSNGHHKVRSTVTQGTTVLTDIDFYIPIHSLSWTSSDMTNTLDCSDGVANKYFDEVYCSYDIDTIHAKDKKLNNAVERACFNDIDDDRKIGFNNIFPDGKKDINDTDCQATYYEIRNQFPTLSAAIDYSDPQTNGIGRLCLGGGTDGYCDNLNEQIQVYYTSRVQPGGDMKIKVLSSRQITARDTRITLQQIPAAFNIDGAQITREQLMGLLEKTPPLCDTTAESCDTIVLGTDGLTASGLDEFITIPIPSTTAEGSYPDMTIKSTITEAAIFSKEPAALAELQIVSDHDSGQESYYTENGLSIWCIDNIDNDMDSGTDDPMKRTTTNPAGFDCRDSDCYNKNVNIFTGTYKGTTYTSVTQKCQQTESVCNDAFDNDYDGNFGGAPDFNPATGVDCLDPDCNNSQGHPTNVDIKCEYLREKTCNDGFDNDALNKKDCDMDETPVGQNPTADTAEYDCANACAVEENTGERCRDNLDNDYDFMIPSGTYQYTQNPNGGIDCRWSNPDNDCNGITVSYNGKSGVCQLRTETTCNDGFDNDFDLENNGRQNPNLDGTAADCDDYDCAGVRDAGGIICTEDPSRQTQIELTCNDGIDNDLDGLFDCADPDCNGRKGADMWIKGCELEEGCLCEYENESMCSDGFDNNAKNGADVFDPNCRQGFCYRPTPEVENITVDSCMMDTNDEDFNGAANCADPNCNGRVCGLNSKCMSGQCRSIVKEVCGDLLDNDGDGAIDCKDPECKTNETCVQQGFTTASGGAYPHKQTISISGSFFTIQYDDYIHKFATGMGTTDGWINVSFTATNVPAGTVDLQVGTDAVPLTAITGADLASSVQVIGTGFTLIPQGTGVMARNDAFAGGNVDVTFKIRANADIGNYNLLMSATSAIRSGTGGPDKSVSRQVKILENVKPVISTLNYYSSADKLQLIATATDASGISKCRFRISGAAAWTEYTSDCIYTMTGLQPTVSPLSIDVEAVDGASNTQQKSFQGISLKYVKQEGQIKFTDRPHRYFRQDESMQISQKISLPSGQPFPTDTTCSAQIFDSQHNAVGNATTLTFDRNKGECKGSIELSGYKNQSSYSIGLNISVLGQTLTTEEKQFFVCKFTQDIDTGRFRCMDACQLNRSLPMIDILEPLAGEIFTYPLVDVRGNVQSNVTLEIFVNSFDQSQYQAYIENVQTFDTRAMMISKGDNSIIARVTDSDNMINSDSVTVEFDGVRVDTEVNVNGLPYNVNSADIRFIVRDYGEELDLEGSEVRMYRENAEDTTVEINRVNYAEESRIRITPSAAITEAGTYKIEVIPKMKSGRYGTGELYRFSYCPGGSHVFYYTEPASKTRDNAFRATGYMEPKPDIARFVFVQPAGGRITYDVSFGADGSFTLDYPELIQQEGINSYYIATVVNGIRCDDIRRAVMYDIEFAGIEEPYVKGEKP